MKKLLFAGLLFAGGCSTITVTLPFPTTGTAMTTTATSNGVDTVTGSLIIIINQSVPKNINPTTTATGIPGL